MAESDPELVRRVQAGDAEAFEELYRRYAPAAYGVALRVLRQPGLAQDVVHDAFAGIWGAPEAVRSGAGGIPVVPPLPGPPPGRGRRPAGGAAPGPGAPREPRAGAGRRLE